MTLINAHPYMFNIVVIIDTNNLFNSWNIKHPDDFKPKKEFIDLLEKKRNNNSLYIDFYISEITIRELIQHQKEYYVKMNQELTKENELYIENIIYSFSKKLC